MEQHVFSDGIEAVAIIGGTARIDFMVLSPTERDDHGNPKSVPFQRVVMSMEGFLRSANKIQEALMELHKAGLIKQVAITQSPTVLLQEVNSEADRTKNIPNARKPAANFP